VNIANAVSVYRVKTLVTDGVAYAPARIVTRLDDARAALDIS
jgi:hypothetical protein